MSIVVKNLSYRYPNSQREAIHGVNLNVERGEFILLVGRSGCGKTTLARCLNGLIPHVYGGDLKGKVLVNGVSVVDTPVYELAKHVGMVFQNPDTQLCTLTVEEEVAFGSENLGVEREEIGRRVDWVLSSLEMESLRRRATFRLSEGEKQRVAVASVLSMLPKILVLDEPTANLDPLASKTLVDTLEKIRREYNTTIILIEHRVEKFAEVADRIIVMAQGKIVESGSCEIITEKSKVLEELSVQLPEIVEVCKAIKISPVKGSLNELRNHALKKMAELKEVDPIPRIKEEGEILVQFENVSYQYGGGFNLKVNDLKLHRGETVAIVGSNGSGKTTLAKLIVGLIKPKKGRVKKAHKISCGMAFQNFEVQLFNNSVFNEVAFQIRSRKEKKSPNQINRRVNEILELMNL
ncbi:MAG: ABC transporter ATP-binding protein [Candidatus Freyarchaeota archaeon]|nr:ABC transporter ATP-binding protein [Candidatus Jordarchaeia archaeon]